MSHTPGPWSRNIKPITRYPVIFAGRNTHVAQVATRSGMSEAEMEANADLIAAAPELLAVCKAYETMDGPEWNELRKAAIAKAEGK